MKRGTSSNQCLLVDEARKDAKTLRWRCTPVLHPRLSALTPLTIIYPLKSGSRGWVSGGEAAVQGSRYYFCTRSKQAPPQLTPGSMRTLARWRLQGKNFFWQGTELNRCCHSTVIGPTACAAMRQRPCIATVMLLLKDQNPVKWLCNSKNRYYFKYVSNKTPSQLLLKFLVLSTYRFVSETSPTAPTPPGH